MDDAQPVRGGGGVDGDGVRGPASLFHARTPTGISSRARDAAERRCPAGRGAAWPASRSLCSDRRQRAVTGAFTSAQCWQRSRCGARPKVTAVPAPIAPVAVGPDPPAPAPALAPAAAARAGRCLLATGRAPASTRELCGTVDRVSRRGHVRARRERKPTASTLPLPRVPGRDGRRQPDDPVRRQGLSLRWREAARAASWSEHRRSKRARASGITEPRPFVRRTVAGPRPRSPWTRTPRPAARTRNQGSPAGVASGTALTL